MARDMVADYTTLGLCIGLDWRTAHDVAVAIVGEKEVAERDAD